MNKIEALEEEEKATEEVVNLPYTKDELLEINRLGSEFDHKRLHATIIQGIPCDFIKFEVKKHSNGMMYSTEYVQNDIKRANLRALVWAEICQLKMTKAQLIL